MRKGEKTASGAGTSGRVCKLWRLGGSASIALVAFIAAPPLAHADEGGVSFWLPGNFGSLAAVPGVPGWSFAAIYFRKLCLKQQASTQSPVRHIPLGQCPVGYISAIRVAWIGGATSSALP